MSVGGGGGRGALQMPMMLSAAPSVEAASSTFFCVCVGVFCQSSGFVEYGGLVLGYAHKAHQGREPPEPSRFAGLARSRAVQCGDCSRRFQRRERALGLVPSLLRLLCRDLGNQALSLSLTCFLSFLFFSFPFFLSKLLIKFSGRCQEFSSWRAY